MIKLFTAFLVAFLMFGLYGTGAARAQSEDRTYYCRQVHNAFNGSRGSVIYVLGQLERFSTDARAQDILAVPRTTALFAIALSRSERLAGNFHRDLMYKSFEATVQYFLDEDVGTPIAINQHGLNEANLELDYCGVPTGPRTT